MLRAYTRNRDAHSHRKRAKKLKWFMLALACAGLYVSVAIFQNGAHFQRSLLCEHGALPSTLRKSMFHRKLCQVDTELQTESFRNAFSERLLPFEADYEVERPSGSNNIAFILTIPACPEDASVADDDPGFAFYDAAAILRNSVCNCTNTNAESGSKYGHTMYAIIHPDATQCEGPTNLLDDDDNVSSNRKNLRRLDDSSPYKYDRVKILEELGFWVIVWGAPVSSANAQRKATNL